MMAEEYSCWKHEAGTQPLLGADLLAPHQLRTGLTLPAYLLVPLRRANNPKPPNASNVIDAGSGTD